MPFGKKNTRVKQGAGPPGPSPSDRPSYLDDISCGVSTNYLLPDGTRPWTRGADGTGQCVQCGAFSGPADCKDADVKLYTGPGGLNGCKAAEQCSGLRGGDLPSYPDGYYCQGSRAGQTSCNACSDISGGPAKDCANANGNTPGYPTSYAVYMDNQCRQPIPERGFDTSTGCGK